MNHRRTSGFTLIEVIVAIVLSAIALAAILPMLDKVFLLSHEPRTTLQAGLSLQSAMEDLVVWHEAHTNLYDVPPPLEQLRRQAGRRFARPRHPTACAAGDRCDACGRRCVAC